MLLVKSEDDTQTDRVANNDGNRVVTQRDGMVQSAVPVSIKCFLMLSNAKSFTWIAGTLLIQLTLIHGSPNTDFFSFFHFFFLLKYLLHEGNAFGSYH